MAPDEKKRKLYGAIQTAPDQWLQLACATAVKSVRAGGGPFGAVIVQIDNATGTVIRSWTDHNHVAEYNDPTAHAEISVLRRACAELGVFCLSDIRRELSRLPQPGQLSHCKLYSSCEPCPMCYGAIRWARLPELTFALTRFDAAAIGFLDMAIYDEFACPFEARELQIRQAELPEAMAAFTIWQNSENTKY